MGITKKREYLFLRECNREALMQSLAETFGKFDYPLVAQQLHNVSHPVVDGRTVAAALKVIFNLKSKLKCEIALQVIRQLPSNLIAIDFYDAWFLRHQYHRSIGCHNTKKVTFTLVSAFQIEL